MTKTNTPRAAQPRRAETEGEMEYTIWTDGQQGFGIARSGDAVIRATAVGHELDPSTRPAIVDTIEVGDEDEDAEEALGEWMREHACSHDGCSTVLTADTEDAHDADHRDACDEALQGNDEDEGWCYLCHGDSSDTSARGHRLQDAWQDERDDEDASEVTWLDDEDAARKYATAHPAATVCRSTNNTDDRERWSYYAHPERICDPRSVMPRSDAGNLYRGQIEVLDLTTGVWQPDDSNV